MKTKFYNTALFKNLVLLISLVFFTKINAQIYNGDLTITTQAQVDSFNYTEVTGNLTIKGVSSKAIKNLLGMSELVNVGGNLVITENDSITTGNFSSLRIIEGNLELSSMADMPPGAIPIFPLQSMGGLSYIGGSLILRNVNFITTFTNIYDEVVFLAIDSIGGDFIVHNDAEVFRNHMAGFKNLSYVGGNLLLNRVREGDFKSLEFLREVGGNITITNNQFLNNFCFLNKLFTVGTFNGNLTITGNQENPTKQEIIDGGICTYQYKGNISISTQEEVDNFNYSYISGNLYIGGNDIQNLHGLRTLNGAAGLFIEGLSELKNLDGLENVGGLYGDQMVSSDGLTIRNNPKLENINGLRHLTTVGEPRPAVDIRGGNILVENNPMLKDLNGFELLSYILSLTVRNNESLTSFCGIYGLLNTGRVFDTVAISGNAVNPTLEEIKANGPCNNYSQTFITELLGKNINPPVLTDGSGGGMFVLNARGDTLQFWIRLCKLECPLTLAYLGLGSPGEVNHGIKDITQYFVMDSLDSTSYFAHGIWTEDDDVPLNPFFISQMIEGNIFVQVNTVGHNNGEIRGQLTWDKPVHLYANLDNTQVVPPVDTIASAEGAFLLSGDGTSLDFALTQNLPGDKRRIEGYFRQGFAGQNGPIVSPNIGLWGIVDDTSMGTWRNTDSRPLTPSLVADLLGCKIYVELTQYDFPDSNDFNPVIAKVRGQVLKTEESMLNYMTIWAARNDLNYDRNSVLTSYTLSSGKQFNMDEGEIYGYDGKKNIVDLTIDIGGNIYFLNNTWASILYRITPYQLDNNPSTSVYAKQMGRLRTPDDNLVWITDIQYIRGKLFGLDRTANKLYDINPNTAVVKEIAELGSLDKQAAGFTLAADGNVYLLKAIDKDLSELWIFDKFPSGQLSKVTSVSSLDKLESFASHPNGRLYASDKNNLYEIDLSAKTVGVLKDHQLDIAAMDFDYYTEAHTAEAATVKFSDISGVTAVNEFTGLPEEFSLSQNYPNPFNPSTTIKYTLPVAATVRFKVYNSLGELVATLVNEAKDAGYYEIIFDGSSLSSGMYIYKIEAGGFVSSSKMILLK